MLEFEGGGAAAGEHLDGLNATLRPASGGAPPCAGWNGRDPRTAGLLAAVPLDCAFAQECCSTSSRRSLLTTPRGGRRRFQFPRSRIGLSGEVSPVTVREILPSPLISRPMPVVIPTDIPEPRRMAGTHRGGRPGGHRLAFARTAAMFVLFNQLRGAPASGGRAQCTLGNVGADRAGRGAARRAAPRFRECGNAILLGRILLGGVDVPAGPSGVVLTKLPFKSPTSDTQARLERLAEQGEDGFMNYLLLTRRSS